MQTVIVAIHLIVVIALVGVVLLQRSEGGALGLGGGGGFLTGRGQANALTRATAVLAALFFITSLTLTIIANTGRAQKSILEGVTPAQTQGGQPGQAAPGGGLLDQLKQIEEQKQQQPASPPAPAAPEPPRQ
jgi:preprotein translocase subunit SecG